MPIRALDKKLYGAKKYRGISELYRKSDNGVSGYYYSFQDEHGKTVKIKADITEQLGTKLAVNQAAAQKAKAILDRDEKLSMIIKIGRPAAAAQDKTTNDLMTEFFTYQEKPHMKKGKLVPGRSQQAINKDRSSYDRLAAPVIGLIRIKDVTDHHIETIATEMMETGKYKQATITNLLIVVQAGFNYADAKKYHTQRPFRAISVSKPKPTDDVTLLSIEQTATIIDKAKAMHSDLYFHTQMLFFTIQRPASISALTAGDIDFKNSQIHFKIIKGQPARKFPITPALEPILRAACQDKEAADRLETISPKYMSKLATVLFAELNEPLYMTKQLLERGDALEIDKARNRAFKDKRSEWLSLYSFRHTGATRLYNSEKDIYLVQEALNHSTPAMTQRYAKVDPKRLSDALGVLAL